MKYSWKRAGIVSAILLSGLAIASCELDPDALCIMTYNVHNAIGLDGIKNYARIGGIIHETEADFIAIQEVDSVTHRSAGKDVLKEIAAVAEKVPVFGKTIDYQGGSYGIGILSTDAPLETRQVALPGTEEKRTLLIAEYEEITFASVHLSLTEEDRMASIPIILHEAEKKDKPFILAGDWNALPDDKFVTEMKKYFVLLSDPNTPTFPANAPDRCIDYIALYQPERRHKKPHVRSVITNRLVDVLIASDHRPITLEVKDIL